MKTKLEINNIINEEDNNILCNNVLNTNNEKKFKKSHFFQYLKEKTFDFAKISLFGLSISYLLNKILMIDYKNQLDFLNNPNLSFFLLFLFSIYSILDIVKNTWNSANNSIELSEKFSSIWIPFKFTLLISLFIPLIISNGINTSFIVEAIKEIVKLAQKLS